MVDSRPNGLVPFSICVDAAVGVTSVARKSNIGTPRLVFLSQKVESAAHINTLGFNYGYVGIVIALFVLGATVCITMGGGFVI